MKNSSSIILSMVALVLFCEGCRRRHLDYTYNDGGLVHISMDWGGVNKKPEQVKALFFPTNNATPVERFINPAGDSVPVPFGDYLVLIYNWQSTGNNQTNRYNEATNPNDFHVYTDPVNKELFPHQEVIAQPDSLYGWSKKEVTKVIPTRASVTNYANRVYAKPKSMVEAYEFFIPVVGLEYVRGAEAILSGVARYKRVFDNTIIGASHTIDLTIEPTATGNVHCTFSTFGLIPGGPYLLHIKFLLLDGSIFDYTQDLTNDVENKKFKDLITPIIISPVQSGGAFVDPSIENWEERVQPIII